jgi:hypothetical protein
MPALVIVALVFLCVVDSLTAERLAKRLSRIPRSVLPTSSSERSPDSFSKVSILPRRFSRPSMYFALDRAASVVAHKRHV